MKATAKNEKIARDIVNILAENGLTFDEAEQILHYASHYLKTVSVVKKAPEKLFETEG